MLLDDLINDGLARAQALPAERCRVHKIVVGASYSTMHGHDAVFQNLYPCTVYLPDTYGFAYGESLVDGNAVRAVMNRDLRDALRVDDVPLTLRVALLDALYALLNEASRTGVLEGDLDARAQARARIVFDGIDANAHVILLGPVSEMIHEARERGATIVPTDRSPQKIGREYSGVRVEAARPLEELVAMHPQTTHVVATGMIFVSGTADEVFTTCRAHGLHLTLYMETGAWFAPALIGHGASRVVAEEFPFYDFAGPVPYRVYS